MPNSTKKKLHLEHDPDKFFQNLFSHDWPHPPRSAEENTYQFLNHIDPGKLSSSILELQRWTISNPIYLEMQPSSEELHSITNDVKLLIRFLYYLEKYNSSKKVAV